MNGFDRKKFDILVENLAAELTEAAYPVALRHGVAGNSIDLELELWKTLGAKLRRSAPAYVSR